MESGYEKDPRDHEGLLGAPHEQEPQALLDQKVILESRGFQVLQRTQAAQGIRGPRGTQDPGGRRDPWGHKVIQDSKASREIQDGLGLQELQDLVVRKALREIQDGQDREEQTGSMESA